jgi:hypothetical protein
MERVVYDGERISGPGFFEEEKRRGDFLFVAWEVAKVNLIPFLSHLSSGLQGVFPAKKNDQQ